MPTVSVVLPNDGESADAIDYNAPILAILAVFNGGLDNANFATGGIATANLADKSVTSAKLADDAAGGWKALSAAPNTITALGNRSYTAVFNALDITGIVSPGMRLRTTRTVAAPTQSTSLNGTTQYYSKTSPAGMTFTNNFVVSAWVKQTTYGTNIIASRFNGTSGYGLFINSSGQLCMNAYNAGVANSFALNSYQSIPLNKWVHVAVKLDMTSTTVTGGTNNYAMIDGIEVPCVVTRTGTNPTALIQAGNLEIGSWNGGTLPFPGKIAQVAIYSAHVAEATILASMHQTLSGSETSLISAYSFNNSINDLNANANNLTAQGSAVATNADSPYGGQAGGTISSTIDYGIITATAFSTNTTLTVQVPEGCTIPTSGGVSAVSYGTSNPYGFPKQKGKWRIRVPILGGFSSAIGGFSAWYSFTAPKITVPIGEWTLGYLMNVEQDNTVAGATSPRAVLAASTPTASDYDLVTKADSSVSTTYFCIPMATSAQRSLAAQTVYTPYFWTDNGAGTISMGIQANTGNVFYADCDLL